MGSNFLLLRFGFVQLTQFFVFSYFLQIGDVTPQKDPVATLQYLLGPLPKLTVTGATN